MKTLTSLLALLVIVGSVSFAQAQKAQTPEEIKKAQDDCKKQNPNDENACLPVVPLAGAAGAGAGAAGAGAAGAAAGLGGLGIGGVALGIGALGLVALGGGGSGGHSSSH